MDGMGETYGAMQAALASGDEAYAHDLALSRSPATVIPADIKAKAGAAEHGYREGESAYTFQRDRASNRIHITPLLKRWIEEKSPPTLYNHGFENMMSAGAVYSRVSSNIFGDWNACGKVMGLAPWHGAWNKQRSLSSVMRGSLLEEEGLQVDWDALRMDGKPLAGNRFYLDAGAEALSAAAASPESKTAAALAQSVQLDLESLVLNTVKELKAVSKARNLCFCGGVALNSVLNGKLTRELGFEQTFIPPYPGDDGIAIGCCAYALFGQDGDGRSRSQESSGSASPPLWTEPLSPYQGPTYSAEEVEEAVANAAGWLDVTRVEEEEELVSQTAAAVAQGQVVAWWQGRSEAGPRALGHRTLLADPRNASMVSHINSNVKGREAFRPFAPSVLAEEASNWFQGISPCTRDSLGRWGLEGNVSPYMSLTVKVKEGLWDKIPAVTHVDGTSRLQSVKEEQEPLYYRLIRAFFKLTGVPMVLNTSFNTIKSEPITESPSDGVRSFLHARGSIAKLVMGKYVLQRRACPLQGNEGHELRPVSSGPFLLETAERVQQDGAGEVSRVRIQMPTCIMSCDTLNGGWITLTGKCPYMCPYMSVYVLICRPYMSLFVLVCPYEGWITLIVYVLVCPYMSIYDLTVYMSLHVLICRPYGGWITLTDELEAEILACCNGQNSVEDIISQLVSAGGAGVEGDMWEELAEEVTVSDVVDRLSRLYQECLISF